MTGTQDVLFIKSDGSTRLLQAGIDDIWKINMYLSVMRYKIRATHWGNTKTFFRDGKPIAQVECSREQAIDSL